jgi:lipid-A-disaccharide synthase-like uncharacterized protein
MNDTQLIIIPYTATALSIIARFIFMFILYKNKSTNILVLLFCILNIISSSMWMYYSCIYNNTSMILRSSSEISLLTISCIYIIINKILQHQSQSQILPI